MSRTIYEKFFSRMAVLIEETDKFYVASIITTLITIIMGFGVCNDWQNGGQGITLGYITLGSESWNNTICYGIGYDNNLPLSIIPRLFSHDSGYDIACCGIFISYIKNDNFGL